MNKLTKHLTLIRRRFWNSVCYAWGMDLSVWWVRLLKKLPSAWASLLVWSWIYGRSDQRFPGTLVAAQAWYEALGLHPKERSLRWSTWLRQWYRRSCLVRPGWFRSWWVLRRGRVLGGTRWTTGQVPKSLAHRGTFLIQPPEQYPPELQDGEWQSLEEAFPDEEREPFEELEEEYFDEQQDAGIDQDEEPHDEIDLMWGTHEGREYDEVFGLLQRSRYVVWQTREALLRRDYHLRMESPESSLGEARPQSLAGLLDPGDGPNVEDRDEVDEYGRPRWDHLADWYHYRTTYTELTDGPMPRSEFGYLLTEHRGSWNRLPSDWYLSRRGMSRYLHPLTRRRTNFSYWWYRWRRIHAKPYRYFRPHRWVSRRHRRPRRIQSLFRRRGRRSQRRRLRKPAWLQPEDYQGHRFSPWSLFGQERFQRWSLRVWRHRVRQGLRAGMHRGFGNASRAFRHRRRFYAYRRGGLVVSPRRARVEVDRPIEPPGRFLAWHAPRHPSLYGPTLVENLAGPEQPAFRQPRLPAVGLLWLAAAWVGWWGYIGGWTLAEFLFNTLGSSDLHHDLSGPWAVLPQQANYGDFWRWLDEAFYRGPLVSSDRSWFDLYRDPPPRGIRSLPARFISGDVLQRWSQSPGVDSNLFARTYVDLHRSHGVEYLDYLIDRAEVLEWVLGKISADRDHRFQYHFGWWIPSWAHLNDRIGDWWVNRPQFRYYLTNQLEPRTDLRQIDFRYHHYRSVGWKLFQHFVLDNTDQGGLSLLQHYYFTKQSWLQAALASPEWISPRGGYSKFSLEYLHYWTHVTQRVSWPSELHLNKYYWFFSSGQVDNNTGLSSRVAFTTDRAMYHSLPTLWEPYLNRRWLINQEITPVYNAPSRDTWSSDLVQELTGWWSTFIDLYRERIWWWLRLWFYLAVLTVRSSPGWYLRPSTVATHPIHRVAPLVGGRLTELEQAPVIDPSSLYRREWSKHRQRRPFRTSKLEPNEVRWTRLRESWSLTYPVVSSWISRPHLTSVVQGNHRFSEVEPGRPARAGVLAWATRRSAQRGGRLQRRRAGSLVKLSQTWLVRPQRVPVSPQFLHGFGRPRWPHLDRRNFREPTDIDDVREDQQPQFIYRDEEGQITPHQLPYTKFRGWHRRHNPVTSRGDLSRRQLKLTPAKAHAVWASVPRLTSRLIHHGWHCRRYRATLSGWIPLAGARWESGSVLDRRSVDHTWRDEDEDNQFYSPSNNDEDDAEEIHDTSNTLEEQLDEPTTPGRPEPGVVGPAGGSWSSTLVGRRLLSYHRFGGLPLTSYRTAAPIDSTSHTDLHWSTVAHEHPAYRLAELQLYHVGRSFRRLTRWNHGSDFERRGSRQPLVPTTRGTGTTWIDPRATLEAYQRLAPGGGDLLWPDWTSHLADELGQTGVGVFSKFHHDRDGVLLPVGDLSGLGLGYRRRSAAGYLQTSYLPVSDSLVWSSPHGYPVDAYLVPEELDSLADRCRSNADPETVWLGWLARDYQDHHDLEHAQLDDFFFVDNDPIDLYEEDETEDEVPRSRPVDLPRWMVALAVDASKGSSPHAEAHRLVDHLNSPQVVLPWQISRTGKLRRWRRRWRRQLVGVQVSRRVLTDDGPMINEDLPLAEGPRTTWDNITGDSQSRLDQEDYSDETLRLWCLTETYLRDRPQGSSLDC